ncbi:MAG: PaaI family thioesterase [Actinobacteria bacterium]|uniref:Acyl-coenzyme A thioesterase THEM4 n=1 Tax=freshwater metagenome TaxID=449393 RepID=A0A6J7CAX8_9ZZZZ|nr:PaaI family thioesterase [Actinomycetota bacterium]MSW76703.1 PaaI family thioesterase [Actinomycetota bacterium]MSX56077.1 PaaI family thioesterase [Actinomycetota bacterium]MSZ82150.1 PaaI family thioesterase [Actinomycetota bacterium]MTB16989.1 PaaI family thioesterase [Actinomycetota bacterium]
MTDTSTPDPWHARPPLSWDGGAEFGPYIEAVRELQDLIGSTNPPADVLEAMSRRVAELSEFLRPYRCNELDLIPGRRRDLPGRGHPFLPPAIYTEIGDDYLVGRVRFTQYYLGGNGAVHGGALPLLFDEVLGHLCNLGGRKVARTAYLHVNYRSITPVDTDLVIEARIEREEGRKRYLSGRLLHGDTLCSDAEGLFLQLLPGQP